MDRGFRAVVLVLLVALTSFAILVTASPQYSLHMEDSLEGPTQTQTIEGTTFEFSAIGSVPAGEPFDVEVTAPDAASYELLLYNTSRRLMAHSTGTGSDTLSFETDDITPGSYVLALQDGYIREILPVVINAYGIDLSVPAEVEANESIEISVSLEEIEAVRYDTVELVLWDGENDERVPMVESGEQYYLTLDDLEPGEYQVSASVRTDEELPDNEERELVAVSEATQLSVVPGPSIAGYADDQGRIQTDGLREAVGDWRAGEIDTDLLRGVVSHWRSGEPVE